MSKRILVVEDQPDNRQIIRDMLAPTGYEITRALHCARFDQRAARDLPAGADCVAARRGAQARQCTY